MKNFRWNLPRNLAISAIWLVLGVSLTTRAFVVDPQKSMRLLPSTNRLTMVRIPFLGGKENSNATTTASSMETTEPVVPQVSTTTQQQVTDPFNLPQEEEEKKNETDDLMQKVKDSGLAGVISYALWELAFWAVSVPVCIIGYQQVTGHLPDLNDKDDIAKLSAEAFAFVNFARFAVPLRIGTSMQAFYLGELTAPFQVLHCQLHHGFKRISLTESKKMMVERPLTITATNSPAAGHKRRGGLAMHVNAL